MPRNPAASCVSKSRPGVVPHARSRTSRSCSAAWMTASAGPESTSAKGATSTASGSTSDPPRPGDLQERETGEVGPLPVELGVERVGLDTPQLVEQ